jgi:hypothetical protein
VDNLILVIIAAMAIAYSLGVEAIDWAGRYEFMQTHFPKATKRTKNWTEKRHFRVALLVIAIALQARVLWELRPPKEPENSLRRRTMQVANEAENYLVSRANDPNRPPFAIPDSSNPDPSDEQKRAIEKYRAYEQETYNYYFSHYKERMVGIVKEYEQKGVRTGSLESDLSQRPPILVIPGSVAQFTYMDDLYQFRELAYHVNADGDLTVITP